MVLAQVPLVERKIVAARVVSTVFILNSAVGSLLNGLLAFVLFTWLALDVEVVFQHLTVVQAGVTVMSALLLMITMLALRSRADASLVANLSLVDAQLLHMDKRDAGET